MTPDSKKIGQMPTVEDQACAWLARLEADDVSARERAEFAEWFEQSARHRAVFRDLCQFWNRLDGLAALREFDPAPNARNRNRHGWLGVGAVAVAAAVAVTVLVTLLSFDGTRDYSTAVGERQVVSLADGSILDLNTDTRITVDFDRQQRHVAVRQGEAHFTIEPDPTRPFRVTTPAGEVCAVGTAFAVRIGPDRTVEVTVTEGVVEIIPDDLLDRGVRNAAGTAGSAGEPAGQTRVTRGQVAHFDRTTASISVAGDDLVARTLAWRSGAIVFDGQTLAEAVREMNRYTRVKLDVVGPDLREIRIGGYFRTGDVEGFIAVLEASFGIEAQPVGHKRIGLVSPGLNRGEITSAHGGKAP